MLLSAKEIRQIVRSYFVVTSILGLLVVVIASGLIANWMHIDVAVVGPLISWAVGLLVLGSLIALIWVTVVSKRVARSAKEIAPDLEDRFSRLMKISGGLTGVAFALAFFGAITVAGFVIFTGFGLGFAVL
jgi:hypothetical protein